jgi:hypothetical protein
MLTPTSSIGAVTLLARSDVTARAAEAYKLLEPQLKDHEFLTDRSKAKALENFVRFVTAQHWMAMTDDSGLDFHALGMDITDQEYWNYAEPMVTPPDLLRSQAFLKLMTHSGTYRYAMNMIEEQNRSLLPDQRWIVYIFKGQFIPSVDRTTYGRMLVVVPNVVLPDGRLWDRWISFAVATPEMTNAPVSQSVSVIATVRDPQKPGTSDCYFADFLREQDPTSREITFHTTFLRKPNPSKNCYNCHKSAVIPIRPEAAYAFDDSGELVENTHALMPVQAKLDQLISTYGKTLIGHLDADAYGPSIGPLGRSRSDEFIAASTRDHPMPEASYAAIRANMNCASCHAHIGSVNYMIGVRTDADDKSFQTHQGMLQTFIEKGYMPPNNSLTPEERHALWECVSKEYFDPETCKGDFVDWLKGKS